MADFRSGVENIQDDPGPESRKVLQTQTARLSQSDSEAN